MVNLRLAALTNELKPTFWAIVNQDLCDYYFFAYDLTLQPEKSQIYLAYDGEKVAGLMLVYDGFIAQLRGNTQAVAFMLQNLSPSIRDIQIPKNCEAAISDRIPPFKHKEAISLLKVKRGAENLRVAVEPQPLRIEDTEEIAMLMRECYPAMWSEMTADFVRQQFQSPGGIWLGLKHEGKLIAFGYATAMEAMGHVTWIATHAEWRNQGYATSIVSTLLRECLLKAPEVVIYVAEDNPTAKKAYLRAGFRLCHEYVLVRA